jgi:hypothetical protein
MHLMRTTTSWRPYKLLIALIASLAAATALTMMASPAEAASNNSKWGAWFKVAGFPVHCRNYVSLNGGSRIKYRGYTECDRHNVAMTVFVAGTGGGHSAYCSGKSWCQSIKYVNNKKGKQKWCAGASSVVEAQSPAEKYTVRACITY